MGVNICSDYIVTDIIPSKSEYAGFTIDNNKGVHREKISEFCFFMKWEGDQKFNDIHSKELLRSAIRFEKSVPIAFVFVPAVTSYLILC